MQAPIHISLPTQYMAGDVNTFLLIEPEPTLIDCGVPNQQHKDTIVAGLKANGLVLSDLKRVVITHAHVDHMGLAKWICDNSDAEIWVSDLVYDWATDLETKLAERIEFLTKMLDLMGISAEFKAGILQFFRSIPNNWESVPAERVQTFKVESTINFGGGDWDVLYLPGHAVHQTGFWNAENGWLFSADCLLPKTPLPVIESTLEDPTQRSIGLPQHIHSLKRLAELPVKIVYPGHGDPMSNHLEVIQHQLGRIEKRKEQAYTLVTSGLHTLPELTKKMYGHYPAAAQFTGMSTIIGYLDLLIAENRITQTTQNNIWHYTTIQ